MLDRAPWLCAALPAVLGAALVLVSRYVHGLSFLALALPGGGLLVWAFCALVRLLRADARTRRTAQTLRTLGLCALACLLCSFAAVECLIFSHAAGDAQVEAEVLIVLGAGLRGETPSLSLQYRLDAAYAYLLAHPQAVAVLTGGQGPSETIPEAEAMYRELVSRGIAPARLLRESEARNTIENIALSRALLEREGLADKPVAVVSNTFHLYRARRICRAMGLEVQTIAAPVPRVGLVPVSSYLREYVSVMLLYGKQLLGVGGM